MASYYKKIPLVPTQFDLHVFVSEDAGDIIDHMKELWPIDDFSEYFDECIGTLGLVDSLSIQSLNKDRIVLMCLNAKSPKKINQSVVVHELEHVLWRLHEYTGIEISKDSQEWVAYTKEQLFNQIIDREYYGKFKKRKKG